MNSFLISSRTQGATVVVANLAYLALGWTGTALAFTNVLLGVWIVVSKPVELHQQEVHHHEHQPDRRAAA